MPLTSETLKQLLQEPESDWLDWKSAYPGPLLGKSNAPDWDRGRGDILKDIVSLANGEGRPVAYLVYGVVDRGADREVIGISKNWDDAIFQTWASATFKPRPEFQYHEVKHASLTVAAFEIQRVPAYPHVVVNSVGGVLYDGQVWYRQGSKNTVAHKEDLLRMIRGEEPFKFTRLNDPELQRILADLQALPEFELKLISFGDLDKNLAAGMIQAVYPGTRRVLYVIDSSGKPDLAVLLKPKEKSGTI